MTDGSGQTITTARFDDLGLSEERLKVLETLGFVH